MGGKIALCPLKRLKGWMWRVPPESARPRYEFAQPRAGRKVRTSLSLRPVYSIATRVCTLYPPIQDRNVAATYPRTQIHFPRRYRED
jgi:hypothetical protein